MSSPIVVSITEISGINAVTILHGGFDKIHQPPVVQVNIWSNADQMPARLSSVRLDKVEYTGEIATGVGRVVLTEDEQHLLRSLITSIENRVKEEVLRS